MLLSSRKLSTFLGTKGSVSTLKSTQSGVSSTTKLKLPHLRRINVRDYKANASDLKQGDVIEHKNKLMEVTKIQHVFGAQRSASMQAEFRDVKSGNKSNERFRVSESVEIVDLDWKVVYFENRSDPENLEFSTDLGETTFLPVDFFKGKDVWLTPETAIELRVLEDEEDDPLFFRFQKRNKIFQIKDTRMDIEQITPRAKPAELTNGVTVMVPPYLKVGAWVKVDVMTEEYISKVDGPEEEEADDE